MDSVGSHHLYSGGIRIYPDFWRGSTVCDECVFEAWERMTYGGVNGRNTTGQLSADDAKRWMLDIIHDIDSSWGFW